MHVIFFHSLPSRDGCSFEGRLFSIFKLLCLVFVRYYLSSRTAHALENCVLRLLLHLDPCEKISSPIQDLFCSHKPLTCPGSVSVECGLQGRTEYPLSQALTFFTQTSVSYWTLLLSRKSHTCTSFGLCTIYQVNSESRATS